MNVVWGPTLFTLHYLLGIARNLDLKGIFFLFFFYYGSMPFNSHRWLLHLHQYNISNFNFEHQYCLFIYLFFSFFKDFFLYFIFLI